MTFTLSNGEAGSFGAAETPGSTAISDSPKGALPPTPWS
jgi:hypothetical protein